MESSRKIDMDSMFREFEEMRDTNDHLDKYVKDYIIQINKNKLEKEIKDKDAKILELEKILFDVNMYHSKCLKRYVRINDFIKRFIQFRKDVLYSNNDVLNLSNAIINDFEEIYLSEDSKI